MMQQNDDGDKSGGGALPGRKCLWEYDWLDGCLPN